MADQTPMVKQYLAIKEKHRDAILFFRLGDFYEMFYEDAEVASKALDLVLTGRGQEENRMPMCGLPYHAADNYIARLIDQGHKVAICEQVEDPKTAKGVVKREVVRIVTPGTVIEANLLSEKSNNYLLAVTKEREKYGLAYVDASTGEFRATELESADKLLDEVNRINPAEVLVSDLMADDVVQTFRSAGLACPCLPAGRRQAGLKTCTIFKDAYDHEAAAERLKNFFQVKSLDSFGLNTVQASWGAAAAILDYLKETQKSGLAQLDQISSYHLSEFMFIDAATRRNLELIQTIRDKSHQGSLLWVLDRTRTSMGGRLLKQWLLQPLLNERAINDRLDAVAELYQNARLRAELGREIERINDIERLAGRIAGGAASARDLIALKESLQLLPKIRELLGGCSSKLLSEIKNDPPHFNAGSNNTNPTMNCGESERQMVDLISRAIVEEPPFVLKEGGLIKHGFDPELDEIKQAAGEGKEWIAHLENEERRRTGIKSLKVGYTRVFGYYIEVTKANLPQVPDNYIRKQTLVNCERFITPELKDKESMILNADERLKEMEYQAFVKIRSRVAERTPELQRLASLLARIDVLLSLAEVAAANHYCRPTIKDVGTGLVPVRGQPPGLSLHLKNSRHPVVERTIGEHQFVPNDVIMDEQSRFLLITGPNMAGKSTYMRQVALCCLLAQIGSFVPADSAELALVDRIFTRIGAMDDIFSGQSTFMMEMTETANILHNATERSLIVLDEIGRGTATFDGMSIAAAVAEYIHAKIKAKTLFATHYHEITQLADKHPGMKNLTVLVKEEGDHIIFLHRIAEGTADRSYGIQVGKLAGLPAEVIKRAKEVYGKLEMVENDLGKGAKGRKTAVRTEEQVSLF